MQPLTEVIEVLGIRVSPEKQPSPFELMSRIEGGLPLSTLETLADLVAPGDALFKYRFIPKATYERRKAKRRLSADEGAHLVRLARIWSLALDVWKTENEVRDFLFRAHPLLKDERPVDLTIASEIGAELVRDVLGSLKFGSAA